MTARISSGSLVRAQLERPVAAETAALSAPAVAIALPTGRAPTPISRSGPLRPRSCARGPRRTGCEPVCPTQRRPSPRVLSLSTGFDPEPQCGDQVEPRCSLSVGRVRVVLMGRRERVCPIETCAVRQSSRQVYSGSGCPSLLGGGDGLRGAGEPSVGSDSRAPTCAEPLGLGLR